MEYTELSSLSERELLILFKDDDPVAFKEIVLRFRLRLLSVANNRLSDMDEAEECVQDVFVNLWRIRQKLNLKHSLNTYLSAAVKNRVFDMLADRYRREKNLMQAVDAAHFVPPADNDMLYNEILSAIDNTLKLLPEKCQIIFKLSNLEGKSNVEIAEQMNLSTKSVESYLTKAKKQILAKLKIYYPIALLSFFIR